MCDVDELRTRISGRLIARIFLAIVIVLLVAHNVLLFNYSDFMMTNFRNPIISDSNATAPPQNQSVLANNATIVPGMLAPPMNCSEYTASLAVVLYMDARQEQKEYHRPLSTLRCYAQRWGYEIITLYDGKRKNKHACNQRNLLFRKHCGVSALMGERPDIQWFVVLDADTGVVNPGHCFHSFIDPTVDLTFYERFFIFEIAAGNYIARNTPFSRQFLRTWADYDSKLPKGVYHSFDNGAIHNLLLSTLIPEKKKLIDHCTAYWYRGRFTYYHWCTNKQIRPLRRSKHIRIFRRAHAWAIDRHIMEDMWGNDTFMYHGWKDSQTHNGKLWSMQRKPNESECSFGSHKPWPAKPENYRNRNQLRRHLAAKEKERERSLGLPQLVDIGGCWPECEFNDTTSFKFPAHLDAGVA